MTAPDQPDDLDYNGPVPGRLALMVPWAGVALFGLTLAVCLLALGLEVGDSTINPLLLVANLILCVLAGLAVATGTLILTIIGMRQVISNPAQAQNDSFGGKLALALVIGGLVALTAAYLAVQRVPGLATIWVTALCVIGGVLLAISAYVFYAIHHYRR